MPNHYKILKIEKHATAATIKKSYKKMAATCHPDKNPRGVDQFREISESYKILSHPEKRAAYDMQTAKICNVNLTLEDVHRGKSVAVDGGDLHISRGIAAGTKVAFAGNIYIMNILPHKTFKKSGSDLLIEAKLTTIESMFEKKIEIKHLDGSVIHHTISPGSFTGDLQCILKRGLPKTKTTYGDLYIRVTVMPMQEKELTSPLRDAIIHAYNKQINNTLKIGE